MMLSAKRFLLFENPLGVSPPATTVFSIGDMVRQEQELTKETLYTTTLYMLQHSAASSF